MQNTGRHTMAGDPARTDCLHRRVADFSAAGCCAEVVWKGPLIIAGSVNNPRSFLHFRVEDG
jgi:hypothetical protein